MNSVINSFVSGLTTFFDWLILPTRPLGDLFGLLWVSVLAGIFLVELYGRFSPQNKLRQVKRRISAAIYESVIFRNDFKLTLAAQARLFKEALLYLSYAVPAFVVLFIPCLLILGQLYLRYDVRGLKPGERVLMSVELKPADSKLLENISLESTPGLEVSPPVREPAKGTATWALTLPAKTEASTQDIRLKVGGADSQGRIIESDSKETHKATFYTANSWERLIFPPSNLFPEISSNIEALEIHYPGRSFHIFGLELTWLPLFFLVSLVAGYLFSRVRGIAV